MKSEGNGPPAGSPVTAGVDVGGTKIAVILLNAKGTVMEMERRPTNADRDPERFVDDLVEQLDKLTEQAGVSVDAVGVGIAGQVSRKEGVLRSSPNLQWKEIPLRDMMETRLDLPVTIANDTDAATWGEYQHGSAAGTDHTLGVFVGTGVGVGAVSGGNLVEGSTASALEFGHVTVEQNGRACSCRNRGCLEAYVGGWAIGERARTAARENPERSETLLDEVESIEEIRGKHVTKAFKKDNPLAVELVQETAEYLGTGLVGMVNVFHPRAIVLGGGVIEGLPELVEMVREPVSRRCFEVFSETVRVRHTRLGDRAPVVGAATLARDALHSDRSRPPRDDSY